LLPGGRYVKVTVKDRGIGIPEEHLKKIFDPYFTTKQTGSGLGLATAYSIITKHSGMILAESEPGAGATFSIYLPAAKEKPGDEEIREDVIMGEENVLLMDDDKEIRKLGGRLLKRLGYQVQTAADGEEAIEKWVEAQKEGKPFALVILDLTVQGRMGGVAALRILKEIDPAIRAIVSSGYSTDSVMANHKKYGFSGVIVKPYRVEDFSRVLRNVIGNTGESTQEII
jgi:CheY-like chemotaxis protein